MARKLSFEEVLLPLEERVKCAMGNLAHDLSQAHPGVRKVLHPWAERLRRVLPSSIEQYTHIPDTRILVTNLLLPVGCNATCPTACATDVNEYRVSPDDLKLDEIIRLFDDFKVLGGKVVRIVGVGEPTAYRQLPEVADHASDLGISTIVCTNGLEIPERVLTSYARPNSTLHFYVKLWSEDSAHQQQMVGPKGTRRYRYVEDPELGMVPEVFARLRAINPERVGFRVLVFRENLPDARLILSGPKPSLVSTYVDYYITQGEGRGRGDQRVEDASCSPTRVFEQPPWPFIAVSVKQDGSMVKVLEKGSQGISVRGLGTLAEVWRSVFFKRDGQFFGLRYGDQIPPQL